MEYGDATLELVTRALDSGNRHLALLMRHSAREFETGVHDLENPLTDEGRRFARDLGKRLPKSLMVRGYASPAQRCVETAELLLEGHREGGGEVARTRPVEGLGVFYILDQMKMYRAMQEAEGQNPFLERWVRGGIARDIMIPADLAARLVAHVATEKLNQALKIPQLDLLVTHDMTLYTVRDRLLQQPVGQFGEIAFLDGMILFRQDGQLHIQSSHGPAVPIEPE